MENRFSSKHREELERVRRQWGYWAGKTCLFYVVFTTSDNAELELVLVNSNPIQKGGEGNDSDDEGTSAAPTTPPHERFLRKDSSDLWALGPLPARGSARSTELGLALHTYISQQWSKAVSGLF